MPDSTPATAQGEDSAALFETQEPSLHPPGMPGGATRYQIAVAGGKGGVGKTTVATNLAVVVAESGEDVTYLDCDVEEPNGHLFLHPVIERSQPVTTPVPVVNQEACTLCGKCAEICRSRAIVCLDDRVMVFPDLCNGCGGCQLVCPSEAIHDERRQIGVVEEGTAGGLRFVQGRLNVACPMSSALIREVKQHLSVPGVHIVDSPAGVSCPALLALDGADYVVVVVEPTVFGMNGLPLTVDMLRGLGLQFGVVINRADEAAAEVVNYCDAEGIEVLFVIPDDRCAAEACSQGMLASHASESYAHSMMGLFKRADRRLVR
jgi:MinD superfamily P-loop ATPase